MVGVAVTPFRIHSGVCSSTWNDHLSWSDATLSALILVSYRVERWLAWLRDLETKGHVRSAGQPLEATGKIVKGGTRTIIDGPFAEAKDVIGGYSIITAKNAAEAAELAKGCPALDDPDGSVEVRPVAAM